MPFHKPIKPCNFNPTRFRMALGLRKLTRQEFAQQSGIHDDKLRPLYVRGEFPEPHDRFVEKIARALNFPPSFFYQGNDDNTLDDALMAQNITFRFSGGPWEIVCDRCDDVVGTGRTEAIAYRKAELAGLVRDVRVGYEQWDLCPRCVAEAPHLLRRRS